MTFVFATYSMLANAGDGPGNDTINIKNGVRAILNKNIERIKNGKFLLKISNNTVEIYSTNDCSIENQLFDSISLNDKKEYGNSDLVARYLSYLELSLKDPHGVKPENLVGYYICVLENGDVTTFAFTGGPNSRGGGPIYLINSKSNKLLEVHYIQ